MGGGDSSKVSNFMTMVGNKSSLVDYSYNHPHCPRRKKWEGHIEMSPTERKGAERYNNPTQRENERHKNREYSSITQ